MDDSFTFDSFKTAFGDSILFEEGTTGDGRGRFLGSSKLIKLEFILSKDGALERATIEFPYFLADPESNKKISELVIDFLELCLPPSVTPQSWIQAATQHLKGNDETGFEVAYGDTVMTLLQMKPQLLFFLSARRK